MGVLHVGRAFVQYAQPLASRSPPSWSRPTRGGVGRGGAVSVPPGRRTGTGQESGRAHVAFLSALRRLQDNQPCAPGLPPERAPQMVISP